MSTESQEITNGEAPDGSRDSSHETVGANLGRRVRIASAAVGGTLLAAGIGRRSLGGTAAALAGGWLCYRGLVGGRPFGRLRDTSTADGSGQHDSESAPDTTETKRSVTVGRSADELYELWRDPETMRRIFAGLVTVIARGEDRWHWTVNGPLGLSLSWDTRIAEDRSGEVLRWASLEDAAASSEGSVHFSPAPADRGTEVTFEFRFVPPGGALGDAVVERLGIVPGTLAEIVLDRFQSLAETGEIPTLEGNPSARGKGDAL